MTAMALGSKPPDMPMLLPFIMFWYIMAMALGSKPPPMAMPLVALKPDVRAPPGALNVLTCVPAPRGCAFLISICRPSSSTPECCIAFSTPDSSANVANAKPFDRPFSRSNMTVASITLPYCDRKCLSDSLVTDGARPPTNTLAVRSCSARGIARLGSI